MMTFETFKDTVDLYSADLSLWPVDMVKPALALVETNSAARAYFDAALALDEALRGQDLPQVNIAQLEARIMMAATGAQQTQAKQTAQREETGAQQMPPEQIAQKAPQKSGFLQWRPVWVFAPSGGLLAAALFGFFIGFSPVHKADMFFSPVSYSAQQVVGGDTAIYEGGVF